MKHQHTLPLFILYLLLGILWNCKGVATPSIKVLNPTYTDYSIKGERGYHVSFTLNNPKAQPVAIILNKIRTPIKAQAPKELAYKVNVLVTSTLIPNFSPTPSDKENGIIFKINGKEVFKPIKFQHQ